MTLQIRKNATIRFQHAFNTIEIKNKFTEVDMHLEADYIDIQSLIDKLTDTILLAGIKYSVRKTFKPERN